VTVSSTSTSALGRLDQLLAVFDAGHPSLSLAGLVARTGLPKTTVFRHATAMVAVGWLVHEDGRYRLGDRLFELGSSTRLHAELRAPAAASMRELAAASGETVHLAVLDGTEVLYVEKIEGKRPAATGLTRIGGRRPAHCTAIGKALVAYSGERARDRLLSTRLHSYTAATIVEPKRMDAELRQVVDRGIARDREETAVGLTCLAAPVVTADGRCVAAVSVSGRADRARLRNLAALIHETAAAIATRVAPGTVSL
jgi:DNA-binding IclR family transcriptional regulator